MSFDPKHLPDDPQALRQIVLDLMGQLEREFAERHKVEALLRELLDAKRTRKSEQLSPDQLALFASIWEARQTEAKAAEAQREQKDSSDDDDAPGGATGSPEKKHGGGRQALPKHLKRERIVHDLTEEEKHCADCQQDLRPIGEETSERYEFIPAQLLVVEDVCKKYACACTVKTATKPSQPIEKSNGWSECAGAGDRGEDSGPSAVEPAGEDLRAARSRDLAEDDVRMVGTVRGTAGSAVRGVEDGAVGIEGDWNGRYQREGAG